MPFDIPVATATEEARGVDSPGGEEGAEESGVDYLRVYAVT